MTYPGSKSFGCRLPGDRHLMTQVGLGKVNIVTTGNYIGMPSSSVLEPVMYLYNRTRQDKYLDFAKYIVKQWETPEGPRLISKAMRIFLSPDVFHIQRFGSLRRMDKKHMR